MALTARQVETARPKEKDYKLSDERGLYPVSYTHLDVYKRQGIEIVTGRDIAFR